MVFACGVPSAAAAAAEAAASHRNCAANTGSDVAAGVAAAEAKAKPKTETETKNVNYTTSRKAATMSSSWCPLPPPTDTTLRPQTLHRAEGGEKKKRSILALATP